MDQRPDVPGWSRRYRNLLLGLVVCRGLAYLCVLPPFEGWDEYQHLGYVVLAGESRDRPEPGGTNVPRSLLAAARAFPQPRLALDQMGGWGGGDYVGYWTSDGQPSTESGDIGLYQAQHGPLYYRLASPLFAMAGGVSDLRRSVGLLRLVNLLMTLGAVGIAIGAAVGTLIAAHPLLLINGVRVANDALGVLIATWAVAGLLNPDPGRRVARWGGLGALIGLAVLAKEVHFGLIPFAACCWLLATIRERPPAGRSLLWGLALALGFLAVTQGELRANLARHGGLTSAQEVSAGDRAGTSLRDAAHRVDWVDQMERLWLREGLLVGGWSYLRPSRTQIKAYRIVIVAGLLGWSWLLVRRYRPSPPLIRSRSTALACVALGLGYALALGYHVLLSEAAWGRPSTNPWYACAALPWLAILVGCGGMTWPLGRWRPLVPLATAGVCLATEAVMIWGLMVPTYSGGAGGWEALHRLARLQPTVFGTATLVAASAGELVIVGLALVAWIRQPAISEPPSPIGPRRGIRLRPHLARNARMSTSRSEIAT